MKAVLFDMDGLIFDTESLYKKSWQRAAKEQGFDLCDEFYQGFIGVQDGECERRLQHHFGAEFDLQRFIRCRDQDFAERSTQGIDYKKGFETLMRHLKQNGVRAAIVTSSGRKEVLRNFAGREVLEQFECLITSDEVSQGKPAPDGYLMACQQLNLKPSQCLALEDSNNGVKSALAAGCSVIMVPDLLPPEPPLIEKVTLVDSLTEVIALIPTTTPC